MGKASRSKGMRKPQATASSPTPINPQPPYYESNLFWVPITTALGFLCLVVGTMKVDFRPLLWFAWLIFLFPLWQLSKNIFKNTYASIVLFLIATGVTAVLSYHLYIWLEPPGAPTPKQMEQVLQSWSSTAGYSWSPDEPRPYQDFAFKVSFSAPLSSNFDGMIMKDKGSDSITFQSGVVFDSKFAPVLSVLTADDRAQLILDIKTELIRMRTGYGILRNRNDDFGFDFRDSVLFAELTEQKFRDKLYEMRMANTLTETILVSKLRKIQKTNKPGSVK